MTNLQVMKYKYVGIIYLKTIQFKYFILKCNYIIESFKFFENFILRY